MSRAPYPAHIRAAAIDAVRAGATYTAAARQAGVSRRAIRNWCAAEGADPNDEIALAGRWVRDGLIWRHEKETA